MYITASLLSKHVVVKFEYNTTSKKKRQPYQNLYDSVIKNIPNNEFKDFLIEYRKSVDYNQLNNNFYIDICNKLEFLKNTLNF